MMKNANDMDIEKRMMDYAINEIVTAEQYLHLAEDCDEVVAQRLRAIAKDEIGHHDFLQEILQERLSTREDGDKVMACLLQRTYNNWIMEVKDEAKDF